MHRSRAARAQLEDIVPADGVESMLAVQMIATHEVSMACLHRATRGGQSPELFDQNLKHAERLLAIYTHQMEVLGRHRARERQRQERQAAERKEAAQTGRQEKRGGDAPGIEPVHAAGRRNSQYKT
jgi:dephospho-CoA kinase